MPTFSVIAFDRCLEPTSNSNRDINKSNVNGSAPAKPSDREHKDSTLDNKKTSRGFISPALYATPAAAPIPSDTVESFNPSPYVVDLKRRGPPIMRDGKGSDPGAKAEGNDGESENGVLNGAKPCGGPVMASSALGETSTSVNFSAHLAGLEIVKKASRGCENSAAVKSSADSDGLEFVEKIWPAGKNSASARSSASLEFVKNISTGGRNPASVTCLPSTKSALVREGSIGRQGDVATVSPNSVLREEDDGCSDDFLEAEEWKTIASSSDVEDISAAHQKSLNSNSQLNQSEYFDALEDISPEDAASQGSEPCNTRLQSELKTLRENLLVETTRRKQIEENLNYMRNQWQNIEKKFLSAGLSFPSVRTNSLPQDMGLDYTDEIVRQLLVARFVAEAVGRGSARAEMEQEMKTIVEGKNREIARLHDKIQFYEVVNQEMSRRNQEVIEIARRRRHIRKKRQRFVWTSFAVAATIGTIALVRSYVTGPERSSMISMGNQTDNQRNAS